MLSCCSRSHLMTDVVSFLFLFLSLLWCLGPLLLLLGFGDQLHLALSQILFHRGAVGAPHVELLVQCSLRAPSILVRQQWGVSCAHRSCYAAGWEQERRALPLLAVLQSCQAQLPTPEGRVCMISNC